MRKNRFIVGIVLGIGLAVAVGSVEAKDKHFHTSYAGIDTNKDDFSFTGGAAVYASVSGDSALGEYTAQLVVESHPDGNSCALPGGGSGLEIVPAGEVIIVSFPEKADQLILKLNPNGPNVGCFDLATSVFTGQATFDVSGGTGRFVGATGTIFKVFQTVNQAPPSSPPGKGFIASFTGTFDGTIELAK